MRDLSFFSVVDQILVPILILYKLLVAKVEDLMLSKNA